MPTESEPKLFDIRPHSSICSTSDKSQQDGGFGAYANRNIVIDPKFSLIDSESMTNIILHQETPIITLPKLSSVQDPQGLLISLFGRLTDEDKKKVMMLSQNDGKYMPNNLENCNSTGNTTKSNQVKSRNLMATYLTNAIPITDSVTSDSDSSASDSASVLCPIVARFNHSCRFNAIYQVKSQSQRTQNQKVLVQIIVTNPNGIKQDEEITVCYLRGDEYLLPRRKRQAIFKQRFGWECGCKLCNINATSEKLLSSDLKGNIVSQSEFNAIKSESNGAKILELQEKLFGISNQNNNSITNSKTRKRMKAQCEDLIKLYYEEQIVIPGKLEQVKNLMKKLSDSVGSKAASSESKVSASTASKNVDMPMSGG